MFEKQLNINQLLFLFTVYQINHLFIISSFILDNSRKKHCSHKNGKWGRKVDKWRSYTSYIWTTVPRTR